MRQLYKNRPARGRGFYQIVQYESTVVAKYESTARQVETYQPEAELEKEFIRMLTEQGYEYLPIHTEKDLIVNLRNKLEELNKYHFTDGEWNRLFSEHIAKKNASIADKTKTIQEDYIKVLKCDDGTSRNIMLIDKKHIHNNRLQVINQYELGTKEGASRDNRYDVTILVNGLPLVHNELKRRGVPIREAFNQINRYHRDSFWAGTGLFDYVQIFVISNGTHTLYYANTTRAAVVKANTKSKSKRAHVNNGFAFTCAWADAQNNNINDLTDFTKTFYAQHTLLNILTKYCVFTADEKLMVMRPYQIFAVEQMLNLIEVSNTYKKYGTIDGGGYIWHTTGSGKTLTSFKAARLASELPYIDKVLFVVDRKDLDYQTMREYDKFEPGAANSNTSTKILQQQLEDTSSNLIITTIQKLSTFVKKNAGHPVFKKHVVIIFDECHRSQFGEMHATITKNFKNYHLFGFTGTPIFANNSGSYKTTAQLTTEQMFGRRLHTYTIINAIKDKKVLPFHVEYIKTMDQEPDIDDTKVSDIDKERVFHAPARRAKIVEYILNHFPTKTYQDKMYKMAVSDTKSTYTLQSRTGFNSMFAVDSVESAIAYFREFKKQMSADPSKEIKVATIFSYSPNEAEPDDILGEENPESISGLDITARDFLDHEAIADYNQTFGTNFDTSGEGFQNYYRDVSMRMKNKEIDLLIVVNMFLTGFDAPTLNTLWVDKNLQMHGLIQAFSRTNRIFNSIKHHGNIVCFRNLQHRVDKAIARFGDTDEDAKSLVVLRPFDDYYYGYENEKGKKVKGYVDAINELRKKYPVKCEIDSEKSQKKFIELFGYILRLMNILRTFDDFEDKQILTDGELQDYLSLYQDLYDEWKEKYNDDEKADIINDVVFETELVQQVTINVDYILQLVEKYHKSNCKDKEILAHIRSLTGADPELRSKRELIEGFIASVNQEDENIVEWDKYIANEREVELKQLIADEHLKENETRKFLQQSFQDEELKTTGTAISELLPPMSRLDEEGAREKKKQIVLDKLSAFFEKYFGISKADFCEPVSEDALAK